MTLFGQAPVPIDPNATIVAAKEFGWAVFILVVIVLIIAGLFGAWLIQKMRADWRSQKTKEELDKKKGEQELKLNEERIKQDMAVSKAKAVEDAKSMRMIARGIVALGHQGKSTGLLVAQVSLASSQLVAGLKTDRKLWRTHADFLNWMSTQSWVNQAQKEMILNFALSIRETTTDGSAEVRALTDEIQKKMSQDQHREEKEKKEDEIPPIVESLDEITLKVEIPDLMGDL